MAKLDALKEKISQTQASVLEKLDKIALYKKWKEKRAQKSPSQGPSNDSLGAIYRQGGVGTRLQVILVIAFALGGTFFTVKAGKKFFSRLGTSAENEKLKQDYSHGLEELTSRVVENASLISMGRFQTNVFSAEKPGSYMAVDVWIRVSDPATAEFAQKHETMIYDAIVGGFSQAYREEINPLTEQGNRATKGLIIESVNKLLPKGKTEEVFFQNLIVQ